MDSGGVMGLAALAFMFVMFLLFVFSKKDNAVQPPKPQPTDYFTIMPAVRILLALVACGCMITLAVTSNSERYSTTVNFDLIATRIITAIVGGSALIGWCVLAAAQRMDFNMRHHVREERLKPEPVGEDEPK